MKKLALFCVLLSLTACTSSQSENHLKYKEKVLQEREQIIKEIPSMHAAESWDR